MPKNRKETLPKASVLRKEIYQANPLINARKDMDIIELRIFALGLRGLNPHRSANDKFYDEEFPLTFIPSSQITEIFGNTKYLHELKRVCEKMFDSHITLNYADGGFELMHIFQRLKYVPKEGLYIQFDNNMKPYILDLFRAKGYTKINIEQIFPLISAYAVRLVELLLQFQGTKRKVLRRKIDLEDLRFALNVPDGAYADRIDNFKRIVLEEPIAEINEKTEYKMSYSSIKTGKRVTGFEFFLDLTKALEGEREASEWEGGESGSLIRALMKHGIRESEARELWKMCESSEECARRLMYAEEELERQGENVANEAGFIVTAMRENWRQKGFLRQGEEAASEACSNR